MAATETAIEAARQEEDAVRLAITGRNISCPAAAAAVRMPVTRPRRATNHRLAIVAAKTMAIEPVPSPISRPQVRISCQPG